MLSSDILFYFIYLRVVIKASQKVLKQKFDKYTKILDNIMENTKVLENILTPLFF